MASAQNYPLHRLVWSNEYRDLEQALASKQHDLELMDPRGRTPLMLSVTLGHLEATRVLLKYEPNVNVINKDGWTVVQEATATGDPEILQMILEKRDRQRYTSRVGGIPSLLEKLKMAPDFYVEMKWEFTSWVPLLSTMCPSDTYKVYKQGSSVRIDTSLLGFDQTNWVRGSRTYIFQGKENGANLYEIDHDSRQVYCEEMKILSMEELELAQSDEQISARLTSPLVLTYLDTDKINFERSRTGLWGWGGSDKTENVSGYECKVFGANNVELVTRTRTEHMTEEEKKKNSKKANPLQSILGIAEVEEKVPVKPSDPTPATAHNPCCISLEDYLDADKDLEGRDIGRPKDMTAKIQKFKGQLWLSEDYPLSLQEQVLPIVDLLALSNTHFQKLKEFICCSLPSGFPVQVQIPLFHVLNARITFGNIFALDTPVEGISTVTDDDGKVSCILDEKVFELPTSFSQIGGQSSSQRQMYTQDADDQLLQYAIRESMIQSQESTEEVDIWEALQSSTSRDDDVQMQIQRAIEASLSDRSSAGDQPVVTPAVVRPVDGRPSAVSRPFDDDDLALALELSKKEMDEEKRKEQEEEEMLAKILALSMTEK